MAFTADSYLPAHLGHVAIAAETGSISTTDGVDTLPTAPASPTLIGYTVNMPESSPNLNNKKGFGIGAAGALYDAPGAPRPSVSVQLRAGSTGFLKTYCQRASGELPFFAVYVGVNGVFTDVYRYCKVNDLALAIQEGGEQSGEIAATVNIMGLAREFLGSPLTVDEADIRALGVPLMFHDVRSFYITVGSTPTDFRASMMSLNATLNHNLEYKGQRPNWGDTNPLSRGAYHLLEHHYNATAQIGLHKRLDRDLFNGAVAAQQWGDITVGIQDVGNDLALNLTLKDALVTNETMQGVDSGAQLSHNVTVELSDIEIDDTPDNGSGSGSGSG